MVTSKSRLRRIGRVTDWRQVPVEPATGVLAVEGARL
jgi:hypothetical protein